MARSLVASCRRPTVWAGALLLAATGSAAEVRAAGASDELVVAPGAPIPVSEPGAGLTVEGTVNGGLIEPPQGALVAPREEGLHWLALVSRDEVDNVSEVRWARLLVDGTPPRVILSIEPRPAAGKSGERWVARSAVLGVRAEDDLCAVAKTGAGSGVGQIEQDGAQASIALDGQVLEPRVLTGWAEDEVGNRSGEAQLEVMVDPWAPQGRIECSGPCADYGSRIVIAEATALEAHIEDPQSGVARVALNVDGAEVSDDGWDGPWTGESYELSVAVRDRAGNTGTVGPVTLEVDREGPEIHWDTPSRGVVDIRVEDAQAGVAAAYWSSDRIRWWPVLGPLRISGGATLHIQARDRVGNETHETFGLGGEW